MPNNYCPRCDNIKGDLGHCPTCGMILCERPGRAQSMSPAPWRVSTDGENVRVMSLNANVAGIAAWTIVAMIHGLHGEKRANARAIVALPELLKAAQIVLNETCGDEEGGTIRVEAKALDRLRASVALAGGDDTRAAPPPAPSEPTYHKPSCYWSTADSRSDEAHMRIANIYHRDKAGELVLQLRGYSTDVDAIAREIAARNC